MMNATETASIDWISVLTMLALVSLLGTIGNLLVLGVYMQHLFWPQRQHVRRQITQLNAYCDGLDNNSFIDGYQDHCREEKIGTPTFFIIVLAAVDLMACCFVVPLSFYLEFIYMKPSLEFWCKAHTFLSVCNIMFSSLLVIAIALDRYFAICHPLHPIMTMWRAKIVTVCSAVFCVVYGLLGQRTVVLSTRGPTDHTPECMDTIQMDNITLAEKYFYRIIQTGNTACFVISILFVLILYSMILRAVLKAQRRIRKYNQDLTRNMLTGAMNRSVSLQTETADTAKAKDVSRIPSKRHQSGRIRFSIRSLTESGLWHEIRSASVLFVVAVVYIIVFTPSLLMANNLVPSTLVGYNSYFLNNMSNPLIYCFMSKAFRRKLRFLCCGSYSRQLSKQEQLLFNRSIQRDRSKRLLSIRSDRTECFRVQSD